MPKIELIQGDCLEVMKDIPDKSIDMILCDLPYGTTACKWDTIIPFEPLWEQYKRIIKDNGAIVLFGAEPFSSYLRLSNIKDYKYDWVWNKKRPTGFALVKKQPMRQHEIISVFYGSRCCYNRQFLDKKKENQRPNKRKTNTESPYTTSVIVNNIKPKFSDEWEDTKTNPMSILEFSNPNYNKLHPTQKPVALFEYLIKTYTNEGDLVLDNCMGSGTTGVACKNLNRNFIGIEKDPECFKIAEKRINENI